MTALTISLDAAPFTYGLPDGRRALAVNDEIALLVPVQATPMEALGGFLQALVELAANEAPRQRRGGQQDQRGAEQASLSAS